MSGDHTKYHGTAEVVKDKGEEHMKLCIYIVCTLILVVAIGYYVALFGLIACKSTHS
jgi:hypothetical protein